MPPECNSVSRSATRKSLSGVLRRNADSSQTLITERGRVLVRSCPLRSGAIIVASARRCFPTAEAGRPSWALYGRNVFLGLLGAALRGTHFGGKVFFSSILFSFVHCSENAKTQMYRSGVHHTRHSCVLKTRQTRPVGGLIVRSNRLPVSPGAGGHCVCHTSSDG